jgi:hypothetical protein
MTTLCFWELGQIIAGFDAVVLLKDGERAHFSP